MELNHVKGGRFADKCGERSPFRKNLVAHRKETKMKLITPLS